MKMASSNSGDVSLEMNDARNETSEEGQDTTPNERPTSLRVSYFLFDINYAIKIVHGNIHV